MTEQLAGIGEPETQGEGSPLLEHPEVGGPVTPPKPRWKPALNDIVRVQGEHAEVLYEVYDFETKGKTTFAMISLHDRGPIEGVIQSPRSVAISNLAEPLKRKPKAPEPEVIRYAPGFVSGEGEGAILLDKHPAIDAYQDYPYTEEGQEAMKRTIEAERSYSSKLHEEAALGWMLVATKTPPAQQCMIDVQKQGLIDRLLGRTPSVRFRFHPAIAAAGHHTRMAEELVIRPRRPKKG